MAGCAADQFPELAGPAGSERVAPRAVSQQSERDLFRCHRAIGPRRLDVRAWRRRGGLRQRRPSGRVHHGARRQSPLSRRWRRPLRRRHWPRRCGRVWIFDVCRVVRLRQRRTAGPVRVPVCRMVGEGGSVLHAGWPDQVVLHAGILQGTESRVVPQYRQRDLRRRDEGGRSLRSGVKGARSGIDRSRWRWADRSVRCE